MELTARLEPEPDLALTASLADEAFGGPPGRFSAARLDWLYHRAFSSGALVVGLFAEDKKVGQVVLLGQPIRIDGRMEPAVALIDLFILPAFRSREAIARLYGFVGKLCRVRGFRAILAVPNGKAIGVNATFLGLAQAAVLDIRVGIARPTFFGPSVSSLDSRRADPVEVAGRLAPFLPRPGDGPVWSAETIGARLEDPSTHYGIHVAETMTLVTRRIVRQGVPLTLVCAMFARPGARRDRRAIRAALFAAARMHRTPFFVYLGVNAAVPPPGLALPARVRPSLMIVQARDLLAGGPVPLDTFEELDFDFA